MKRQYRLKNGNSFRYLYRKGKSVANAYFVLYFTPVRGGAKVGFSVSKKIGNSVTRNKLKRRLRAIWGEMVAQFTPSSHFVVIAKKGAESLDFGALTTQSRELAALAGYKMQEQRES